MSSTSTITILSRLALALVVQDFLDVISLSVSLPHWNEAVLAIVLPPEAARLGESCALCRSWILSPPKTDLAEHPAIDVAPAKRASFRLETGASASTPSLP